MVKKEKEPQVFRPKAGERIICASGPMRYEARVLEVRDAKSPADKTSKMEFFVHYQGWNKNWDEWVDESRVFQFNEVNVAAMKAMKSTPKNKGTGSARKKLMTSTPSSSTAVVGTISKDQRDNLKDPSNVSSISSQGSISESIADNIELDIDEPFQSLDSNKEVKIKLPDELKNWLIDDDNNIKNKKLTTMPAKPNIFQILRDFVAQKKGTSTKFASTGAGHDKEAILNELTLGIKDYFNVMLGSHLLYKFERIQYQSLLKEQGKDIDLTQHYGVIHLVRLFTKIGKYLSVTTLDSQSVQTILNYIQELLKFVAKQPNLFDLEKNYTIAPPEYIKNALK